MLRRAAIQDLDKIMYVFEEFMHEIQEKGIDEFEYNVPTRDTFREDIENGRLYLKCIGTDIAGFVFISNSDMIDCSGVRWSKNTIGTSFYKLIINIRYRDKNVCEELMFLAEDISKTYRLNYVKAIIYEPYSYIIDELKKHNYSLVGQISCEDKKYKFCCYDKIL